MATIRRPRNHREELRLVVQEANPRFALAMIGITLGTPILAYLAGDPRGLFYVHVALGAFWFGLDFFFKFVLGPSLDAVPQSARSSVNARLVPKMVTVAEPLSVGVIGSGIVLAEMLGYWASPGLWLWGALGIGVLMLAVGFGPLHVYTTRKAVEFAKPDPTEDRIDDLFGKVQVWGLVQTVLMLLIIAMMTGIRWGG